MPYIVGDVSLIMKCFCRLASCGGNLANYTILNTLSLTLYCSWPRRVFTMAAPMTCCSRGSRVPSGVSMPMCSCVENMAQPKGLSHYRSRGMILELMLNLHLQQLECLPDCSYDPRPLSAAWAAPQCHAPAPGC